MIEQSLCYHLQAQLTEYYRLVAVLESQMGSAEGAVEGEEDTGLTLKRLDVWINEWRLRMRMMSVCVEGARGELVYLFMILLGNSNMRRCSGWCTCESHSWVHR